jgi:dynein heavy chain
VSNMILENARWDIQTSCLVEPEPMAIYAPLPVTHFKPVSRKKTEGAQEPTGVYHCPLYIFPLRVGTKDKSSFMIWVDLKSGQFDQAFWTKRGAALLLSTA